MRSKRQGSDDQASNSSFNFSSSLKKLIPYVVASESDQLTHPVDTIIRRTQNFTGKIDCLDTFKRVAFNLNMDDSSQKLSHSPSIFNRKIWRSLFDGFTWSALNKGVTRTWRYFTYSAMEEKIEKKLKLINYSHDTKAFSSLMAGFVSGLTETLLFHPFDNIKTRIQLGEKITFTNPPPLTSFYRGLLPALIRNTAAAGVFFGSYNYLMKWIKRDEQPTVLENLYCSTGAALINTVVTNPLEVVKTRLQGNTFSPSLSKMGMFGLAKNILKNEGITAFFKGLTFKATKSPFSVALPYFAFQEAQKFFSNTELDSHPPSMKGVSK